MSLHQSFVIRYGSSFEVEESEVDLAALPTSPNPASSGCAQRLLEAMHPVCSHDLPNQAVAMQSLLQLFSWDEAERLSPQGREYLERLQSVAAKTFAFTQYLKEMSRLQKHTVHIEKFAFDVMVDEMRGEMQRQFSNQNWTWETTWHMDHVRADRRLLHHGIANLLRSAALSKPIAKLAMQSTAQAGQVDWNIAIELAGDSSVIAPVSEADLIEARLALSLAHEHFGVGEMVCRRLESEDPTIVRYALSIPERSPHD